MLPIFEVMTWQWERTTLKATSFPGPLLLRHRGPSRRGSGNEVVFWVAMVWQVCPCFSFPTDWRKCPHHNMYDTREPCGIHIKGKMAHSFCLEGKLNLHGHSLTSHVCKCHDGYIGRANHPECVSLKGKRLSLRSCDLFWSKKLIKVARWGFSSAWLPIFELEEILELLSTTSYLLVKLISRKSSLRVFYQGWKFVVRQLKCPIEAHQNRIILIKREISQDFLVKYSIFVSTPEN